MKQKKTNSLGWGFVIGYILIAIIFGVTQVDIPITIHVLAVIGAILITA